MYPRCRNEFGVDFTSAGNASLGVAKFGASGTSAEWGVAIVAAPFTFETTDIQLDGSGNPYLWSTSVERSASGHPYSWLNSKNRMAYLARLKATPSCTE